jgi:Family of unknown function (DUF6169)
MKETIISIIHSFFHQNPDFAVSYVCDNSGGEKRSSARSVLFKRWFLQHNSQNEYVHLQGVFVKKQKNYYTGILFSIFNENKNDLKDAFYILNQELNK